MLRAILGVVAGWLVTGIIVFISFSGVWMVLGASGAFEEGSWDVSTVWCAAAIVVGLIAAVIGGAVCAAIARTGKAVIALVVITLVLGFLSAAAVMFVTPEEGTPVTPRPADVTMIDAMGNAKQPVWITLANPIVGAVGIMLGARLVRRKDDGAPPAA